MDERKLKSLKSRLCEPLSLPVVGRCLQKKAVTALAEDISPKTIKVLSEAAIELKDEEIKASILSVLNNIEKQECINSFCSVWANTRHRDLTNILVKKGWVASTPANIKVLSALKTNNLRAIADDGKEIVEPLLNAFEDRDTEIANRASQCALSLANSQAIDYLCQKWSDTRDEFLEQLICKGKYLAQQPVHIRVLTALKINRLEVIKNGGTEIVKSLLDAIKDSDSKIVNRANECTISLSDSNAIDFICCLAIEQNHQLALQIAMKAQYAPHEPSQRALFYFLSEQWDKYESLDYDHTLLQKVYELGDEKIRKRVLDKARQAGHIVWVEIVAGGRKGQRLNEMTDTEWKTTIAVLSRGEKWEEMWRLAQKAPAIWCRKLLLELNKVIWMPQLQDEQVSFARLKQTAQKCSNDIPSLGKLMYCIKTLYAHSQWIYKIDFSPNGKLLASCSSDGTIKLWQIPTGNLIRTLTGHRDSVKYIDFSPDGKLLASCSSDGTIKLWQTSTGKLLHTINNDRHSEVNGIIFSPDGKLLLSSDSEGIVKLRQVKNNKLVCTFDKSDSIFDDDRYICFSPDGKFVADCSSSNVRLWRMPDGKQIQDLEFAFIIINGISFSPNGKFLAA